MPSFEKVYNRIKLDLELAAEENGGMITATELRKIVMERIGIDKRTYANVRDALVFFGKLKPVNQYTFRYLGKDE